MTIINPQLRRRKLVMTQTAPGRYAADFTTLQPGAYNMEIALKQDGQVVYRQSRGLIAGYSDELRIQPANEALLKDSCPHFRWPIQPGTRRTLRPSRRMGQTPNAALVMAVVDRSIPAHT